MTSRAEVFLSAVDVLQSGRSLDVEGEHGSGRTHFLQRITDYFVTLGWRTIVVSGLPAFTTSPLVALAVAGVADVSDGRPGSIAASVRSFADAVVPGRTLVVVDDGDALDAMSSGVIRTVQARLAVPVLSSRLIHRDRSGAVLPTGSFTTTYAMRLPPMGFGELDAALEDLVGFRIEAGTLSRIFAKSGGTIGLAAAVVDAAQRAGRLEVEDGVGRATGSLWSPALRRMTEVVLAPLSTEAVEALEILALLGPADLSTAAKAVGFDRIGELEDRAFLSIVDAGGARIVSIHPPLLVEHFRHDALPGRRAQLLARIDDLLAAGPSPDAQTPATARDSAAFVRLVHEHTRRRTLRAREAWDTSPTLLAATELLTALDVDGAHGVEELDALVASAHGLSGSERERAEWAVARLTAQAVNSGEPRAGIEELRTEARSLPREGGLLLGRAAELELTLVTVADTDPLATVEASGMSTRARAAILRARAFWMLARGLHRETDETLDELRSLDAGADPLESALTVLAHLSADRMALAVQCAEKGLAAAQRDFDATGIRIHAFAAALAACLDRRADDAEHILDESSFLGLASPLPPLSFVGLKTLAAELAGRRGQRGLLEQLLADIDAAGFADGPFLGQNSGIAYARLAEVEEGPADAAEAAVLSGDALWDRGALLSAAHAYLEGVVLAPTPELWDRVRERVAAVQAPLIVRGSLFAAALVARDAHELARLVAAADTEGRERDAVAWAARAVRALDDGAGDADHSDDVAFLRERGRAGVPGSEIAPVVSLTPREREVAELVAAGLPNSVIAEALVLSVRTVETHVNRLLHKAGLHRRQDVRDFLLGAGAAA